MLLSSGMLVFVCYLILPPAESYITWIEKRYPLPGTPSPPGSPWPMPRELAQSDVLLTIDPNNFVITSDADDCDVISEAKDRYRRYIIPDNSSEPTDQALLKVVHIKVLNKTCQSIVPGISTSDAEEYNITVAPGVDCANLDSNAGNQIRAEIVANTVWAALRGLETFAQLVWEAKNGSLLINQTCITDYPRYSYRGILLDTARHFQPLSVIKKNLDAMEWNKMNVFHWHIVDDQSFPFESIRFPNLTVEGAYTPKHIYTQEDIANVISYARLRGIRVILEFDTPGHTMGFGQAFPELLTPCYADVDGNLTAGTANYSVPHSDYEILDPTNNFTYWFMEEFFKEVRDVLQDEYVHLGMDEVYYGCWLSSPVIKAFMEEKNFTDIHQVEQHYVEWMIAMVERLGFKYITWQDPVDNGVKMAPDTIIHVWKDTSLDSKLGKWQDYMQNITEKNDYKIILSACWYLNYISYGPDWRKYYECDPRNFTGTEEKKDLVIGGEACLWGEYVDGTNLIPRLWPRASAVAERLWSDEGVNNTDDAAFRLDEQRCRMLRRGIPTQPILNGFCGEYDWEVDPSMEYPLEL